MTGSLDPWRTLGLTPGASIDEIRRAYRRLAKVNHPDAAGEAALPRFLAIQSAYEALAGPRRGRRPGSRPAASPAPDPWRADPGRARPSAGTDSRGRPSPGSRPAGAKGADPASSRGAAAKGESTTGDSRAGARAKPGRAGEPGATRRGGGRRRPPNRATPGSTSYDAADEEPFEPGWTGATWYGASSGTYWTINPKEYADPRKHGPEYQRRARRSASGRWIIDDEPGIEPEPESGADESPSGSAADEPDPTTATGSRRRRAAAGAWPPGRNAADEAAAGAETAGAAEAADRSSSAEAQATRPGAAHRPSWTSAGREPGERRPLGDLSAPPPGRGRPPGGRPLDGFATPLMRLPTTPAGRLGLALLGWPPLGVAAATAVGESTGCGRFAAGCAEVFAPGTWILQVAIVLLLLAAPRLAGWSAVGTLVALAAAIPTAVVLSAGGGSRQPEASAGVLLAVLGLAYVGGVAWAIAHRWWPSGRSARVPWRR
jgi:curved DNA-binding protein CbpA